MQAQLRPHARRDPLRREFDDVEPVPRGSVVGQRVRRQVHVCGDRCGIVLGQLDALVIERPLTGTEGCDERCGAAVGAQHRRRAHDVRARERQLLGDARPVTSRRHVPTRCPGARWGGGIGDHVVDREALGTPTTGAIPRLSKVITRYPAPIRAGVWFAFTPDRGFRCPSPSRPDRRCRRSPRGTA